MSYTLTKIKTFRGMEGQGLNATLMHNGEAIAFVLDDANGGEVHFDFRNPGQTLKSFNATTNEDADREEKEFGEYCLVWFLESGGQAERAERHKEFAADWDKPPHASVAMEYWVNHHVDEALNKRRFDRLSKTRTLFRLVGDKPEVWRTISAPWSPAVQASIEKKYGADKIATVWRAS
jgi:hypothetical protein